MSCWRSRATAAAGSGGTPGACPGSAVKEEFVGRLDAALCTPYKASKPACQRAKHPARRDEEVRWTHGFGADVRGGGSAARGQPMRLDADGDRAPAVVRGEAAGVPASAAGMVRPRGCLSGRGHLRSCQRGCGCGALFVTAGYWR